jgi:hypothetical protein
MYTAGLDQAAAHRSCSSALEQHIVRDDYRSPSARLQKRDNVLHKVKLLVCALNPKIGPDARRPCGRQRASMHSPSRQHVDAARGSRGALCERICEAPPSHGEPSSQRHVSITRPCLLKPNEAQRPQTATCVKVQINGESLGSRSSRTGPQPACRSWGTDEINEMQI